MKGPWGFGKTLAAASFAVEGPIWIAYWDKKKPIELQNYFYNVVKRPELLKRIDYDVYGASNAGEYLEKLIDLSKSCPYFALSTDSVTNLTSGAVNWSLSYRAERKNKDKLKVLPDWDEYKVETSLVTQALDICRSLPCHIIWTAHPLPGIKVEGSGNTIKVTKVNPIVSYGSKVAGIVPGQFSEIYHFSKTETWDTETGKGGKRYIVNTDQVGDEFAKSNIGLSKPFDITDRLFYEVWKEEIKKFKEESANAVNLINESKASSIDPFAKVNNPWA
jgi:hypothetical protein